MNSTHSLKLSLAVLSVAALLSACGDTSLGGSSSSSAVPTIEDVKAWRVANVDTKTYNVKSYEVSDLSCSAVSKEELETVKKSYSAFGMSSDDLMKALVQCSYTVNASLVGRDKEYRKTQDRDITNHKVKDEKFGLLVKGGTPQWMGTPRLPKNEG
ncbi:hypothetical protein [Hydrogenophaga sp.]|uniref:hypothetical protein n=1 Tax=Hydrogenophaga sp. TaxID=1904254 RepID=UPI0027201A9E|nr:hypothetical protein [Hydrogenophaga sp.]MDO9134108.1 hypothetical protein [Hydrogenophaga sp.]